MVLASIITITFVGVGPLPKKWLKKTFRVRRAVVGQALEILRLNNRHYRDVQLDSERLRALPEDDVPDELMVGVRRCSDSGLAAQESDGYVPDDTDEGLDIGQEPLGSSVHTAGAEPQVAATNRAREGEGSAGAEPEVAATNGAREGEGSAGVDMDLTKLTANDLMMWGLSNLWKSGEEGGYAARHGRTPVNEFGRENPEANLFERAFPCLFPYGVGGIEGAQTIPVDFREHIQWALQYHDRRFSTHESFAFVAFGILQRRQALGSARVQMRRHNFEREARTLSTITVDKMRRAQAQEAAGEPITDPAVNTLKRLVHGAGGRVQGTDASRYNIRGQIWSTCLACGPPSLWVTINPSDIHDPIAQVFAGADINLDDFDPSLGPSADSRARAIAQDPFAASKFFHFIIDAILETLFQVKVTSFSVKAKKGVLGMVSAYVGSIESQGRGTLHLHMLLWLANTPTSTELEALFKTAEFRSRVVAFIKANLRAYLPGLESADTVRGIPKEKEIPYSRPPHPDSSSYRDDLQLMELRLARAQQVHTCKERQCLKYDKDGNRYCKRRAPFERAEEDYVTASGRWSQKRLYQYMNGWNPAVLVNARCNNDAKLLTNGGNTKNITFYVSSYTGKKQGKNYNMSAVMADAFAYHESHPLPQYAQQIREQQRLLLFRIINAVNREQELAAPMVISYLMGWGDVKMSHTYAPLYWTSFVSRLTDCFPELQSQMGDLKPTELSWAVAFDMFESEASDADRVVLAGAQYFHECASAADGDSDEQRPHGTSDGQGMLDDGEDENDYDGGGSRQMDEDGGDDEHEDASVYTEEGLQALKALRTTLAERQNADAAVAAARLCGYFPDTELRSWDVEQATAMQNATRTDLEKLEMWREHMDAEVDALTLAQEGPTVLTNGATNGSGSITAMKNNRGATAAVSYNGGGSGERPLDPVAVRDLRTAQFRAYDIIVWHLEQTLAGNCLPPLHMVVYGEGGTGKSRVIQTVTEAFHSRESSFLLVKSAYTGIAASLIDGKTLHTIAHINVRHPGSKLSDAAKRALQAFWRPRRYLVLDEYSMVSKTLFSLLSKLLGIAMEGAGLDPDSPFGGISVILCGDLHQFPPVACSAREALYRPVDLAKDTAEQAIGRRLYECFDKVVILDEQMRVTDDVWRAFLTSLRKGEVTEDQINMLRALVLSPEDREAMMSGQWRDAKLVTPRHAVRRDWNGEASRSFSAESGERLFVIEAEDRIQDAKLELSEKFALAGKMNTQQGRRQKDLPDELELAKGMKVMVTRNLKTELDIANGARGEIVDIILHPDEPPVGQASIVKLNRLPAYVLVKLDRTKAALPGLDEGVIPVEPITSSMAIHVRDKNGKLVQRTVRRRQFPITGAYCFTDYRSQGQTIPVVIVDIKRPPPPGGLSLFNLYVALSRSHGRDTLRVLREFEPELLLQKHEQALLDEDERLKRLNDDTKAWWESLGRGRHS
uniref:ATP-dependent DNA helicase n=1 Tax=Ganoderma boninense TaxID=34458 RepID=A0A5K1JR19_9APHY|nr:Vacuolar protein sorting-associated protein 4 [Ganoderma boninense]